MVAIESLICHKERKDHRTITESPKAGLCVTLYVIFEFFVARNDFEFSAIPKVRAGVGVPDSGVLGKSAMIVVRIAWISRIVFICGLREIRGQHNPFCSGHGCGRSPRQVQRATR